MTHLRSTQELTARINELYSHIRRLEEVAPTWTGKVAARGAATIKNLRLRIIDLERLL
jgi:hypothetical protein